MASPWQRTGARFEMRRHYVQMERKTADSHSRVSVAVEWPPEYWISATVEEQPDRQWGWYVWQGKKLGNGGLSRTESDARRKAMVLIRALSTDNRRAFLGLDEIARREREGYEIVKRSS